MDIVPALPAPDASTGREEAGRWKSYTRGVRAKVSTIGMHHGVPSRGSWAGYPMRAPLMPHIWHRSEHSGPLAVSDFRLR